MIRRRIENRIKTKWIKTQIDYNTKAVLSRLWVKAFGYPINWDEPKDLNEKIQWLIVNSDTSEWSRLSDKVLVRDYVREKGLAEMLVPLLGTWDDAQKIEFDKMPEKFVLKCNHDSGSTIIVDKSKGFDRKKIVSDLNNHLKTKFGYISCEPHYNKIKPLILAEELLNFDAKVDSKSPIDYKFFCANGEPHTILVVYDRNSSMGTVKLESYDLQWNYHPEYSRFNAHYINGGGKIPRPKSLNDMISAARILSAGFPQVRVDFYDVDGKAYFGELTFTSDCGRMPYFTKEFLLWAGNKVDLNLAPQKRKWYLR